MNNIITTEEKLTTEEHAQYKLSSDKVNFLNRLSKNKSTKSHSRDIMIENMKDKMKEEQLKELLLDTELACYSQIKREEFGLIDETESHELFLKYQFEEFGGCVFLIGSIVTVILYYHLISNHKEQETLYRGTYDYIHILNIVTILNLFSLISTVLRYIIKIEYLKCNKLISSKANILNSGELLSFIIEILLILLSPNIYYNGIIINASVGFNRYQIDFELNYFFFIFLFLRIYRIVLLFLSWSDYFDFRAGRIAGMIGMKISTLFAIKSLIYKYPKFVMVTNMVVTICIFSFFLFIFEGPAYTKLKKENIASTNDFRSYGNCVWFLIVTITTIGFGDYYPVTNIGRIITVFVALLGNINISILIYTTQVGFTLSPSEQKVYNFTTRMESKAEIDKVSAAYFKSTIQFILAKNELVKFLKSYPVDLRYVDVNDPDYSQECINLNIKKLKKLKERYYQSIYTKMDKKRKFKQVFQ